MLPFEFTKDTPYLALSGELWSVFYEYFNTNYKGFLLYWWLGSTYTIIQIAQSQQHCQSGKWILAKFSELCMSVLKHAELW